VDGQQRYFLEETVQTEAIPATFEPFHSLKTSPFSFFDGVRATANPLQEQGIRDFPTSKRKELPAYWPFGLVLSSMNKQIYKCTNKQTYK